MRILLVASFSLFYIVLPGMSQVVVQIKNFPARSTGSVQPTFLMVTPRLYAAVDYIIR